MMKVAFCDDDLSVLSEISNLLKKYRTVNNRKMSCDVKAVLRGLTWKSRNTVK